jgi:hypothetical protein
MWDVDVGGGFRFYVLCSMFYAHRLLPCMQGKPISPSMMHERQDTYRPVVCAALGSRRRRRCGKWQVAYWYVAYVLYVLMLMRVIVLMLMRIIYVYIRTCQ